MSGQGRTMMNGGRSSSAPFGKGIAPQELYSRGSHDSVPQNPFTTLAPVVMGQESPFRDDLSFQEPTFEEEALNFNTGKGFFQEGQSLNLRQQASTLFETPAAGAEQVGAFTMNARTEAKPSLSKSGDIFNGYEHTRQRNLSQLREQNKLPAVEQRRASETQSPLQQPEVSTLTRSAQEYEAHAAAKMEQERKKLSGFQKKRPTLVSVAGTRLAAKESNSKDKSEESLVTRALKSLFMRKALQNAAEMARVRAAKKATRKGPVGLDMGGNERRGDAVAEMTDKAQTEAGHEFSDVLGE